MKIGGTGLIDKKIHYIWLGGEFPDSYRRGMEYTEILNADHEVILHGFDDVLRVVDLHTPQLADLVRSMRIPAAIADIGRLALLFEYGGWYVDADTVPRVALNYWTSSEKDAYVFTRIDNSKVIVQNSLLASRAGHPMFLGALKAIENIVTSRMYNYSVYRATGPTALLGALSPYLEASDVSVSDIDYSYIDGAPHATKGSWTFQENCGIVIGPDCPPVFNPHSSLDRIGSIAAWNYYRSVFDDYSETRASNYRALIGRLGVHHVHQETIKDEVLDLVERYMSPDTDREFYEKLLRELVNQGDSANAARFRRDFD